MIQTTSKHEVADFIDRYVTLLDARRFDDWLALFTEDCFYTLVLNEDYVKDNNMLAIGEDKRRLIGRIEVGQTIETGITMHLTSGLQVVAEQAEAIIASANFVAIRAGVIHCWGRYQMELVREAGDLHLSRCTAILYNETLAGTIYLPV